MRGLFKNTRACAADLATGDLAGLPVREVQSVIGELQKEGLVREVRPTEGDERKYDEYQRVYELAG